MEDRDYRVFTFGELIASFVAGYLLATFAIGLASYLIV